MLKVEYAKHEDDQTYYLVVNDIPYYQSRYNDRTYRSAYINEIELGELLASHSSKELSEFFDSLNMGGYDFDAWPLGVDISFSFKKTYKSSDYPNFNVELNVDTEDWASGWSIKSFSEALKIIIKDRVNKNVRYFQLDDDFVSNGFGIAVAINDLDTPIGTLIDNAFPEFESIINDANLYLASVVDNQSVISFFNFPDSIKGPCQQYLMYFAQFLKDLGIEAETEIKEQAHSTLFKITPNNKDEALDKIKDALEIYTNTPALNDLQFQCMNNGDIAFMQLQANVMHLKSQIMLNNAALQMKDATIEALQLSNYQLKAIVAESNEKLKQEEEIIPGIMSIKKYDGEWFSLNLPEMLNRLKRRFIK